MLFVCLTAYYVVGGIGSRKGYGVFGPGSLAAASFARKVAKPPVNL